MSLRELTDFFRLHQSERKGVLVLLVLLFSVQSISVVAKKYLFPSLSERTIILKELPSVVQSPKQDTARARSKTHFDATHKKTTKPSKSYTGVKAEVILDLNSASVQELQQIRGIGPVRAEGIVKYRMLLGGYCSTEQLSEVYSIPDSVSTQLQSAFTIKADSWRTFDFDSCAFKSVLRHPYFDYQMVKSLFRANQKYSRLDSSILRSIDMINDSVYHKLKPYIVLNKSDVLGGPTK